MNRLLIPLALIVPAALVVGCASMGNVHQVAEKADTDASLIYVGVAEAANAYEATTGANVAKAEGVKLQAWKALAVERQAYAVGSTVDLTPLTNLLVQAKALGH